MGNCLSSQAADDLSLLNDSDGASLPGEPPPPYQQDCPDGSQRGINFIEHKEKPVKGCFAVICPVKRPDSTSEERDAVPVYHPTPSQTRLATQLTEEEQVWIAQRIGLIHHLPKGSYDPGSGPAEKKLKECVICMLDFVRGDHVRFLPCMHIYHVECIDDWLMRSFTCPSCMEPVDAALLSSYETN